MHKLTIADHLNQSEKTYPGGSSGAPNGAVFSTSIARGPGSALPTVPSAIISLTWDMYMYALDIHEVTMTSHPVQLHGIHNQTHQLPICNDATWTDGECGYTPSEPDLVEDPGQELVSSANVFLLCDRYTCDNPQDTPTPEHHSDVMRCTHIQQ